MRIANFTNAGVPAGGAPRATLAEIMAQKKALAEQQGQIAAPREIGSWTQGAAQLAQSFVNARQQASATDELAQGREALAKLQAGINYDTGPTPEQISQAGLYDPEAASRLQQMAVDAVRARREREQRLGDIAAEHTYQDTREQRIDTREQQQQIEQEKRAAATQLAATTGTEERARIAADIERAQTPLTDVAKLNADLKAGRIDQATYDQLMAAATQKAKTGEGGAFKPEMDLRKEYMDTPQFKRFDLVRSGYERLATGAKDSSPAGDIALVYGYMKLLDPGSVVREGEFATAQNAGSVPQSIWNLYNRIQTGERLSPEQRAQFANIGNKLYAGEASTIGELNKRFSTIAQQSGLDPKNVIEVPQVYPDLGVGDVGKKVEDMTTEELAAEKKRLQTQGGR